MSLKFDKREKASGYYYQGVRLRGVKLEGSRITVTVDPDEVDEGSG